MARIICFADNAAVVYAVEQGFVEGEHSICLLSASRLTSELRRIVQNFAPDLILLDMQLPDISGLDVAQSIKASGELKHIPIIAVTASVMKGDEERIMASGCDIYVSKPVQIAEFMRVIRQTLDNPPTAKA